jgi:CubicO group peptidase (beta-lactamase class C family)
MKKKIYKFGSEYMTEIKNKEEVEITAKVKARAVLGLVDNWLDYQTYIKEIPSVSVGIFIEDEVIFQKSYGYANLDTQEKATPQTMYRIASHSKLFTATAIMRLRAEGKLRLDDPVSQYLNWFTSDKDENLAFVTLRQLLTHSSGLTRDGRTTHWTDNAFPDKEEIMAQVKDGISIYTDNEHWKYSNVGFTVLGQVIEAVTGKPYEEAVMELVVDPLGLENTTPDITDEKRGKHAVGYGKRYPKKGREALAHVSAKIMNSATGFSSTVEDMLKFYQAHMMGNETFLKDRDKREMQRIQFKEKDYEWGLGFGILEVGKLTYVRHGGGYLGFITQSGLCQEHKLGIVVLTNAVDGPALVLFEGLSKMIEMALTDYDKFDVDKEIEAKTLDSLAGFYRSAWGVELCERVNGKLVGIAPDLEDPVALLDIYEHVEGLKFKTPVNNQVSGIGEEFYFEVDQEGKVKNVVFRGGTSDPFEFEY